MIYLVFIVAIVILAIVPIWLWSRRIEKRVEPPERPGHEEDRFRLKYGGEPPGGAGSGTISGAS